MRQILGALDVALFQQDTDGRFARVAPPPAWLRALWPPAAEADAGLSLADRFLYLHSFLEDARALWTGDREGEVLAPGVYGLRSDRWSEEDASGTEWFLEALALRGDENFLVLRRASIGLAEHRRVLQEGRSLNLDFQHVQQALHRCEVDLECLIHDASEPLANLRDALALLTGGADVSADDRAALLELARSQVQTLDEALQDTISDAPTGDGALSGQPADLGHAVQQAIAALSLQANMRQCGLVFDPPPDRRLHVVAAPHRLRRVVRSMLAHGLRRTPDGEEVRVVLRNQDRTVVLSVIDPGPPVPEHVVPYLFERFGPNDPTRHTTDHSLYFCRIAAESWGGEVGYQVRNGTPRIWMGLPKADGYDRSSSDADAAASDV
jgi:signal transduction histidine kinase